MVPKIQFFSEGIDFRVKRKEDIRIWIKNLVKEERKFLKSINFIFCEDDYLLHLNHIYLSKDYYTDVIAFPADDNSRFVSGDVFISIERVRENALKYRQKAEHELLRVIAHGILHLAGYSDSTEKDRNTMKSKEEYYLAKIKKTGKQ